MIIYFFTMYLLFPFLKIYHRAEREGLEHIPKKGPCIVVANHASFFDPWYLSALFPPRWIHYLTTTRWYYKSKIWKLFFDLNGCIAIKPGSTGPSTLKQVIRILKKGGIVGIFPEGKITYDGKLLEFDPGAIYLASRENVPIIPVAICGSYAALPRQRKVPKPTKIKIIVGKPRYFAKESAKEKFSKDFYNDKMLEIKNWIEQELRNFDNQKRSSTHRND